MNRVLLLFLLVAHTLNANTLLLENAVTQERSVYYVILAGGSGERLWPLSRQKLPKQLLSFDTVQNSFLRQAIERVSTLAVSKEHIWVVCSAVHAEAIREHVGDAIGTLLVEPSGRNTGPAILNCCRAIAAQDPAAVVVFLPADPYIPQKEYERFTTYLAQAVRCAIDTQAIALLGVKPTYPATGYGYIETDQTKQAEAGLYRVKKFHEKPSLIVAKEYVQRETMLWNIGMFCAQVSFFIEQFQQLAPDVYAGVDAYSRGVGTYEAIPSISVDYAVIEKSQNVWALPVDFTWFDVGNVAIFLTLKEQFASLGDKVILVDAQRNLVDVPHKVVALVGVDDLCVVETEDALLIVKNSDAEKVKHIVNQLKIMNNTDYL